MLHFKINIQHNCFLRFHLFFFFFFCLYNTHICIFKLLHLCNTYRKYSLMVITYILLCGSKSSCWSEYWAERVLMQLRLISGIMICHNCDASHTHHQQRIVVSPLNLYWRHCIKNCTLDGGAAAPGKYTKCQTIILQVDFVVVGKVAVDDVHINFHLWIIDKFVYLLLCGIKLSVCVGVISRQLQNKILFLLVNTINGI